MEVCVTGIPEERQDVIRIGISIATSNEKEAANENQSVHATTYHRMIAEIKEFLWNALMTYLSVVFAIVMFIILFAN